MALQRPALFASVSSISVWLKARSAATAMGSLRHRGASWMSAASFRKASLTAAEGSCRDAATTATLADRFRLGIRDTAGVRFDRRWIAVAVFECGARRQTSAP